MDEENLPLECKCSIKRDANWMDTIKVLLQNNEKPENSKELEKRKKKELTLQLP